MKISHVITAVAASFGSVTAMASTPGADASLPPGASEAFDTILSQVGAFASEAWPIVVAVTGVFVGIKLFKRVTASVT